MFDALGVALSALPDDTPIAIAYSGGLDSTVLLHAAARIAGAGRCIALHVHHGLSANADAWLAHCAETAQALGARFDAARVDVPRASGQGIEASARDARYRALETMCARYGARTLWLAQHADDQAETVLLQLLRGAGIAGLAAMAPQYRPALVDVVRMRPLLHLLRAQLERYAQQHALRWIDDESNTDTRYARNALRVDVLPALAPHFPGFRDALARTAQHAAAAQRLLDDLAAIDLRAVARADVRVLSRDAFVALDDERGANLLRYWMRSLGLPGASAARLAEMVKQLRAARDAHALRVDHAGWRLRLYRDDVQWEAGDGAASEARAPMWLTMMRPMRATTGPMHRPPRGFRHARSPGGGTRCGACPAGAAASCSVRSRRTSTMRCRRRCSRQPRCAPARARAASACAPGRAAPGAR